MKIVASTKVVKATRAMQAGKSYGLANSEVFAHTAADSAADSVPTQKRLYILCGGIHSSVSKAARRALVSLPDWPLMSLPTPVQVGAQSPVIVVGDKFKSKAPPFPAGKPTPQPAISYEAAATEVLDEKALKASWGFSKYEMEDDFKRDLAEFSLTNSIFAAPVESHACEQNARRAAMDNASKNAADMIGALQMKYNRGRQAAITKELVRVGASAL
ncbi:ATPase, F1 complex, gamma subunit domain-containing protein [Mycena maculata]|uniref:ATPase, F1 complex, gamma subunit domain-containing protein n=1 Tax=Mycena maculata TaxID=230809 RepID=A0AAD7NER9_9AGAR|nr:ATPase, F1 complex, gamma subunit domain-containing protein [Mycena maculata]